MHEHRSFLILGSEAGDLVSLVSDEYEISEFRFAFDQGIDFKGQPQHETKGGQMSLTIGQATDKTLYEWASKATLRKSGKVVFQTQNGQSVIRIQFRDAYCVRLERRTGDRQGTHTTFVIAPGYVKMNESEHSNYWV